MTFKKMIFNGMDAIFDFAGLAFILRKQTCAD
jgi:hypothetical protein